MQNRRQWARRQDFVCRDSLQMVLIFRGKRPNLPRTGRLLRNKNPSHLKECLEKEKTAMAGDFLPVLAKNAQASWRKVQNLRRHNSKKDAEIAFQEVFKHTLGCQNSSGERERVEVLSRFHRPRRQVENPPGFQVGEIASCTSGTGRFSRRKSHFPRQKLEKAVGGAEPCRFCVFAKGETAMSQIENLRRGTRRGRYPVHQFVKNTFRQTAAGFCATRILSGAGAGEVIAMRKTDKSFSGKQGAHGQKPAQRGQTAAFGAGACAGDAERASAAGIARSSGFDVHRLR